MRNFINFIQVLVIVCSFVIGVYARRPEDYNNEEESRSQSQSDSNEVGGVNNNLKIDFDASNATAEPDVNNTDTIVIATTEKAPEKSQEKSYEKFEEQSLENARKQANDEPEGSSIEMSSRKSQENIHKKSHIKGHAKIHEKAHDKAHKKAHDANKNNHKHSNATREHHSHSLHHEADKVKSEDDRSATTLINYPFAVSVQRKGAHYATGALIDKRWILSSATEFFFVRESIKLFRARLGSVDCKRGGILVPLKRVELHPSYVYGEPNYDLSLLRLAQPVDYTDFIRPIGFSNIKTQVISAKFMITYWPRLIVKGQPLPMTAHERIKQNSMRVSTQRLIPRERCEVQMQNYNTSLDESTLCLKPFVTHHSACLPDAGAPVVAEDGLWGITSSWVAPECLTNPSPTVFSRISSEEVTAWLDSQLMTKYLAID